ncbi:PREDICTED: insulin-like 3 [Chinchilla lanigera]|uniref:Insulin-like 3 n=1 Tax=Chinchilla lanigera TaxID=34839 RepID=A0A8C2V8N9_CHILA|nr:PREDICTED: insulin-like 3 [Chinchilla lanigera]
MELRARLLLLLLLLLPAQAPAQGSPHAPEARHQLCGRHLLRALVRVCGGPRWSREAGEPATRSDRERLRPLPWPAADRDPAPGADPQPLPQASRQDRRRREAEASNPAQRCCLAGCTRQDLLSLCPH